MSSVVDCPTILTPMNLPLDKESSLMKTIDWWQKLIDQFGFDDGHVYGQHLLLSCYYDWKWFFLVYRLTKFTKLYWKFKVNFCNIHPELSWNICNSSSAVCHYRAGPIFHISYICNIILWHKYFTNFPGKLFIWKIFCSKILLLTKMDKKNIVL